MTDGTTVQVQQVDQERDHLIHTNSQAALLCWLSFRLLSLQGTLQMETLLPLGYMHDTVAAAESCCVCCRQLARYP